MMNKLQKIEINRYRGIKNMTLDNLSRVNVLIGENNSGKTSILEAIQLLSDPFSESLLLDIVFRRLRGTIVNYDFKKEEVYNWIFPHDKGQQPIVLSLLLDDVQTFVRLELFEQEFVDVDRFMKSKGSFVSGEAPTYIEREVHVKINEKEKIMKLSGKLPKQNNSENLLYEVTHIIDVSNFRFITVEQVDAVIFDQKKDKLIEILKQFDREIIGIETISVFKNNQIYIQKKIKKDNREVLYLMPLSSFGDGLQKIVYIASKLLNVQDGVLLLDEAEVGIHTKMIPTFFEWLSKLAEDHNVTIFMTTHSLEAVDGILAANKESLKNLSFYRLEKNKAKWLSGQRMYEMRYNFAMEVRG